MMQVIEITKTLDHIISIIVSISLPRPYGRIVGLTLDISIFLNTRFFLKPREREDTNLHMLCGTTCGAQLPVLDASDVKD